MMRPRELTVAHEAAHVVARYILGTLGHVDLVELPASGNAGGGASARVSTTRTVGDVIRSRAEAEKEIVSTLAGCAAMRALGLEDGGGEADELMAGTIVVEFTDGDVDASVAMYDECLARAERLVASPRFQDLLVRLCVELEAVPAMSGNRAQELLRSWDPEAPVFRQWDMSYGELAARYRSPSWGSQTRTRPPDPMRSGRGYPRPVRSIIVLSRSRWPTGWGSQGAPARGDAGRSEYESNESLR